jgi:PAS domain S-box-containing protein
MPEPAQIGSDVLRRAARNGGLGLDGGIDGQRDYYPGSRTRGIVSDPLDDVSAPIEVLHVDDDPDFLELAATALEAQDDRLHVATTTDIESALERLEADEVDCVVSDYEMPVMDGIAFLEAVRERAPELPFVLFTGKGSEAVASEAISAGVTDYLQKQSGSGQFAVLANRIMNLVDRYDAERERRQWVQAIETATQGIAIIDGDGVFRQLNAAYASVYDAEPADMVGTDWRAWYPPEEVERFEADILPQVRAHGAWSGESVGVRVDGTCVDESLSLSQLEEGGHVCVVEDISERKAHERALERERSRMELALRATDSYLYEIDLETGEEWRFGDWAGLHGLPSDAAPTTESFIERCVHPADRDFLREKHAELEQTDRDAVEWEYRTNPDADGPRWFRTELTLERRPDGDSPRAVGLATDITAQKERELSLRQQNERLETFASMVSHDLRNPLTVVAGRLELTRERYEDDGDLAAASRALDRAFALIEELLAVASGERPPMEPEPVALADAAEHCWQPATAEAGELRVETDRVIEADEARLYHLLENLFVNAVEHGSAGQPTHVDDAVADGGVTVTVGGLDGGFYVEDDGVGIPEADRERAFERRYSTRESGTGVGLSLVRQVAEAHGWTLSVTESEAGGLRVEITDVAVVDG